MIILHVITGLNDGGAEGVLYRLCKHDKKNRHVVVSLSGPGKYGPKLRDAGSAVYALCMRRGRPSLAAFFKLISIIRDQQPDIVQTWMYHADLLGGLAARLLGIRSVVWNIRQSEFSSKKANKLTVFMSKILAISSYWMPARIVVCSQQAMATHKKLGYNEAKMRFIPNGYNLSDFKVDIVADQSLRATLVPVPNVTLLGMIARYDPMKDHSNLLNALAELRSRGVLFQCVLAGFGIDQNNRMLSDQIKDLDLTGSIHLLGQRTDVPEIMGALDFHVLSSSSEAFPNVIAEAMAAGTPCVVTDVGDAAWIVGDTGWVAPPGDSRKLADSIEQAINDLKLPGWVRRSIAARERIAEHFSIDSMVNLYNEIWQEAMRSKNV